MAERYVFGSLTRIAPLAERAVVAAPWPRDEWATGDYVVGEVLWAPEGLRDIELTTGRMAEVSDGDLVVGALGRRHATLEMVGDWREIRDDLRMDALTSAGLFGRLVSRSHLVPLPLPLLYRGHVLAAGVPLRMSDCVPPAPDVPYSCPTVLIIGTSMSSGKTTTAKVVIQLLQRAGLRVVAVKLTGAGRYRDTLAMQDAGAARAFDFVDVGLPSTVCPADEYRVALRALLARVAAERPAVVVAEAGASPLEPYNGEVALQEIGAQVAFTVLCASDPYAVVGVMKGFGLTPHLVSGITTNNSAAIALVHRLTGLPALNVLRRSSRPQLAALLRRHLALPGL